jgi:hypothetical protein
VFRRFLFLTLLLTSCALTSGCFEFRQEFWINPDGSGRVLMDIGIQQIGNPGAAGQKEGSSKFEKQMQEARERLSKDPNVKRVQMSQETREGMLHTIFDIEVNDLTKLADSMRQTALAAVPDNKVARTEESVAPLIEKLPNGDYAFRVNLDRGQKKPPASNPQTERFAEQMVEKMFAGRFWMTVLHAPKVVETNGQLNATSNLIEWKIPLAQLASDKAPYKELTARVEMPSVVSPQRWMPELASASAGWGVRQYAVLGGAALLVLAAVFLLFRSLRRAS